MYFHLMYLIQILVCTYRNVMMLCGSLLYRLVIVRGRLFLPQRCDRQEICCSNVICWNEKHYLMFIQEVYAFINWVARGENSGKENLEVKLMRKDVFIGFPFQMLMWMLQWHHSACIIFHFVFGFRAASGIHVCTFYLLMQWKNFFTTTLLFGSIWTWNIAE